MPPGEPLAILQRRVARMELVPPCSLPYHFGVQVPSAPGTTSLRYPSRRSQVRISRRLLTAHYREQHSAWCSFDVRFLDGDRMQMDLAQEKFCLPEYERWPVLPHTAGVAHSVRIVQAR